MNARLTGLVSLISCFVLMAPLAIGGGGGAKPIKRTVRAEDGLRIVCEVRGKGDTALVFLHGWCGDREYWKHHVDVFAADYRVVTVDQAGHGESGKDRKNWTVAGLAGDVEALVKALGLKRVILIGHSMGGPVSLMAARRMPGFTPTDIAINKKYADYDAVIIDAVGHYPMLERPAEFNQKLRDVLKEFAAKK